MAIFRIPLLLNKNITFSKLLGCGKNGTFDINPDFQQWGLMIVWNTKNDFVNFRENSFIWRFWKAFTTEQWTLLCSPYDSHGKWDGKEPFGSPIADKTYQGRIAVLTRATIRWNKLITFWRNVPRVADSMTTAKGLITSVGIGEAPFVKQATFSIWESLEDVKQFAYGQREHAEVVKLTRQEGWYSEELFARFIILESYGTLNQKNPLN